MSMSVTLFSRSQSTNRIWIYNQNITLLKNSEIWFFWPQESFSQWNGYWSYKKTAFNIKKYLIHAHITDAFDLSPLGCQFRVDFFQEIVPFFFCLSQLRRCRTKLPVVLFMITVFWNPQKCTPRSRLKQREKSRCYKVSDIVGVWILNGVIADVDITDFWLLYILILLWTWFRTLMGKVRIWPYVPQWVDVASSMKFLQSPWENIIEYKGTIVLNWFSLSPLTKDYVCFFKHEENYENSS